MVTEHQLDPKSIAATGKSGRVTKTDVVDHLSRPPAAALKTSPIPASKGVGTPSAGRGERREKMSRMRQTIAERLVHAQQTTAMLTTFNEIDMTAIMGLRKRYKDPFQEKHGVGLGFMSFFVKASVAALQKFPEINGWIEGNEIVYHDYYDVGVAVSTDKGLMVPVIRDCDKISFADIEGTIVHYSKKARDGKISLDDLAGGTFTVSNGGTFGSLLSTPILNPPQSAILGMHKIEERAVVIDGQIVARPMMYVALSYDHRIVDGRGAVGFLVTVKQLIEDPSRLLLGV
jgi:2-oxoglutarate dehydrogenase E2 component (dihydrolipoamide succinyltransferase)